jgi:hypothetical protein
VLLYIAAHMLRLHYVTLPLLQGRGPKGERAHARATELLDLELDLCLETPRTCSQGCSAGGVQVRKSRSWGAPEEFPWEDFLFSRFPMGDEDRKEGKSMTE